MFENPRRERQARNFTTNVPKILVVKSSSEQIFSRKLPLGAPVGMPYSVSIYHSPLARPWALRLGIFLSKVLRHVVTHPYMTCKRCTIDFIK